MRMIYQYTNQHYETSKNKRAILNFVSRLHWHCHFIQKFEDECSMEFENVNKAYDALVKPKNESYIKAWQEGKTGVPIVDACMRCLVATGYINFRMRAMLVSFLTHNLWQDWRFGVHHLAKQFLDFEPGIHYPQFQMQAATMGVHIIRTYNPIKQSYDHDENGEFIKQWIPELSNVPKEFIHEPWLMNLEQQQTLNCIIGKDYPAPIVDLKISTKMASNNLWALKKSKASKVEVNEILNKLSHRNSEVEVKLGDGVVDRESTFKRKKKATKKISKKVVEQVKMDL
jgi:deoxyribodipyrimidine photo-lyase